MDTTLHRVDSAIHATPYGPINSEQGEIRLLEVDSGEYDDDMTVSLRCVKLSHKPVYPVLSYVWGERISTRSCIVDGMPMSVTLNLFNFLLYLRSSTKRTIWIDALCINQADMEERAAQVRQMKAIYEGAICIYGWIGLPFDFEETRQAVIMMRECNKYLREGLQDNNDDIGIVFNKITKDLTCFPGNAKAWMGWDGIAEICNSHFWRRVWIYQEVTTPKKIRFWCGHHVFDDILLAAATSMAINFAKLPDFSDRFARSCGHGSSAFSMLSARIRREEGHILTLIELMQEMRISDCTDPRDRVYAPLGHAVDVPAGRFKMDYKIDPIELFLDAARYMILEATAGLGTLRYVFTSAPDSSQAPLRAYFQPAMPSWVPDWRQKIHLASAFSNFLDAENDNTPLYTPLPGPVDVCIKGPQLLVQGFVVQESEVTLLTSIWDQLNRSWKIPHTWYNELLARFDDCPALDRAIRRSMVADRTCFNKSPRESIYKCKHGGLLDWQVIEATSSVLDPSSVVRPADMFANLYGVCYGRRLGVLSAKRIAILPAGAKQSDKIAAFQGGHALYLVRPLHGSDKYQFIGECYVDGWMNGEIVEEIGGEMLQTITMV